MKYPHKKLRKLTQSKNVKVSFERSLFTTDKFMVPTKYKLPSLLKVKNKVTKYIQAFILLYSSFHPNKHNVQVVCSIIITVQEHIKIKLK